jgi:hypothetical protein
VKRIEEFEQGGKNFIYFNLSGLKSNDEYIKIIEEARPITESYAGRELYSITNIKDVAFDTKTKKIAAEWMAFNKAYVKYSAIIGVDGIKQIMMNAVFAISKRKNVCIAPTKEKAIEILLMK